jgi:hypothetical protein
MYTVKKDENYEREYWERIERVKRNWERKIKEKKELKDKKKKR